MTVPAGALPRAALVAIPLALVVLIFVTPGLIVRPGEPQATDIPLLFVKLTGDWWNATVNGSAVLYVRSALGFLLYDYIGINVSGADAQVNLTGSCGGMGARIDLNWTCGERRVPSVWLKLPALDASEVNVTAVTVHEDARFRYNATIAFAWDTTEWVLRVTPEGETDPLEFRTQDLFSASMRQEAVP